jgi:acyl-CoA hydrolase/GNAT superfamily N-acetyltransferase
MDAKACVWGGAARPDCDQGEFTESVSLHERRQECIARVLDKLKAASSHKGAFGDVDPSCIIKALRGLMPDESGPGLCADPDACKDPSACDDAATCRTLARVNRPPETDAAAPEEMLTRDEISYLYPGLANHLDRLVTPEKAVAKVKAGDQVFIGTACATPRQLVAALENVKSPPPDVTLTYFLTTGAIKNVDGKAQTHYHHRCFFVGSDVRHAAAVGIAEYIPISLSQVPQLITTRRIPIDVAFVQVSPPDAFGFVSLGISVDITLDAVNNARSVVAEINPNMPRTMGDSHIHISRFDAMTWVDTPILEYVHPPIDEVAEQIARYIASIIEDGSTLQVGLGRFPNEALKYLMDRRDLGIHSDVITDSIIPLLENGILTGREKSQNTGKIIASYCLGTRRLYDLVDNNPMFFFKPLEYVSNIETIARQSRMVSVTQAFAVDLTGQICADQFEGEFYSGVSTQPDFMRGAGLSKGGKPIICLRSTTDDGKTSRIRALLREGEGVTVARSDVHYVITEYGIAYLFGKSIQERALALIEIAHPAFRDELVEAAKKLNYVHPEQIVKSAEAYHVEHERSVTLKNGKTVLMRPSRASDAVSIQALFHRMSEEDRYTRFFRRLHALSFKEAQRLCNVDNNLQVSFVAVIGTREDEKIIGNANYFVNPTTNMAEVAYVVLPEWQGTGLGSALQAQLMDHAKVRGLRGFIAEVLTDNKNMVNLAKRACNNVSVERHDDTYEITMLFEEEAPAA